MYDTHVERVANNTPPDGSYPTISDPPPRTVMTETNRGLEGETQLNVMQLQHWNELPQLHEIMDLVSLYSPELTMPFFRYSKTPL